MSPMNPTTNNSGAERRIATVFYSWLRDKYPWRNFTDPILISDIDEFLGEDTESYVSGKDLEI